MTGPVDTAAFDAALAGLAADARAAFPADTRFVDAHTHLGLDDDGRSLGEAQLGRLLDEAGVDEAVVIPLHDPARKPAYRVPNDRLLAAAAASGGRFVPFCRLDPADDPIGEAERCLAAGARGLKLHPHSDGFNFLHPQIGAIFDVADRARVPILIHTGPGLPSIIDGLCDELERRPTLRVILAHAGVSNLGLFATRLAAHPGVVYDTAWLLPFDLMELAARVPIERILHGSDPPYGRPVGGLFSTSRLVRWAGLDDEARRGIAGDNFRRFMAGEPIPSRPPRRTSGVELDGRLARVTGYLHLLFGAVVAGNLEGAKNFFGFPLVAARDPDPGPAAATLARIGELLKLATGTFASPQLFQSYGLAFTHAALVMAAFGG